MSDELDRLFECLVEALSRDARLAIPFPAADLYERLVPYRSNRSRLKVATHQDYEMTVLRLLAAGKRVATYPTTATWLDLGRFEDLQRAAEIFAQSREEFLPGALPLAG